jgi:hypothetical protein
MGLKRRKKSFSVYRVFFFVAVLKKFAYVDTMSNGGK